MSFIGNFKKIDNRALTALFAGLIPFGIAVPAYADSGVSISGRVVAGVQYIDNVSNGVDVNGNAINESVISGDGNNWGTSFLNISGFHDLNEAGDMRAVFNLETGFNTANGEFNDDGSFLNRRAYAGLQSDHWGTLLAGRNLTLSADTDDVDPFYQQTVSAIALGRGRIVPSVTNMVGYNSPTWAGWYFQVQYGLGNDKDSFHDLRRDAVKLTYNSDALTFHAVYDVARDEAGKYTDLFSTSRQFLIGAAWHLNSWDLYAGYNNLSAPDVSETTTWSKDILVSSSGVADKGNHYWLGANWAATDRWELLAAVYQMDVSGKTNDNGQSRKAKGKATLAALGTTYNFSDDFLFYATFGRVFNQDSTDFSVRAFEDNPSQGREQNVFYFGFSYTFDVGFGAFAK